MNEFDQFAKHQLRTRQYVRYCDDFIVLSENRLWLESLIDPIQDFLKKRLNLELHPDKVYIKAWSSGVDFLGWVHFPSHRVLRTATKRRMMKKIKDHPTPATLNSYLGLLRHGNTYKLRSALNKEYLLATDAFLDHLD